ncbi:MAG: hypothetical protein GTN99_06380 [Candidatus Dadabacteria bacterium]|nr:hypothetical protein [Candidatus Dadabacteria bacterium]NIT13862.1 hypothetical protein [Candidatus Dadabacteria bacterium]
MITIIVSDFGEVNEFIENGNLLKHYRQNNIELKNIEIHSKLIQILQSGVGIKNARNASNFAVNNLKSEEIYMVGVCGALSNDLKIADIVEGQWVYSIQNNRKISLTNTENRSLGKIKTGGILTHNRFVSTQYDKNALYKKTNAQVVDMETWGAAEICEKTGTSLYGIRSVSDIHSDNLPELGYVYNSEKKINIQRAIKYFSAHPYLFFKFLEFKHIKLIRASSSLSAYLSDIFKD